MLGNQEHNCKTFNGLLQKNAINLLERLRGAIMTRVEELSVTIIIANLLVCYADMITKYSSHHSRNIISNITALIIMPLLSAP